MSKLTMIDMAGNDKVIIKGEPTYINKKSMKSLELVVEKLVAKSHFVPFSGSVLTRLLSNALCHNSKTCVIITALLTEKYLNDTIATMKFGQNIQKLVTKPQVNEELTVDTYQKLLIKAKNRNNILKKHLIYLKNQVQSLEQPLKVITDFCVCMCVCVLCFFFCFCFVCFYVICFLWYKKHN